MAVHSEDTMGDQFDLLIGLYILGEKLLDSSFRNTVIGPLVKRSRVARLWDEAKRDEPKNQFYPVDWHVFPGGPDWIAEDDIDANNKEFLVDLAVAMLAKCSVDQEHWDEYGQLDKGIPSKYFLNERR